MTSILWQPWLLGSLEFSVYISVSLKNCSQESKLGQQYQEKYLWVPEITTYALWRITRWTLLLRLLTIVTLCSMCLVIYEWWYVFSIPFPLYIPMWLFVERFIGHLYLCSSCPSLPYRETCICHVCLGGVKKSFNSSKKRVHSLRSQYISFLNQI